MSSLFKRLSEAKQEFQPLLKNKNNPFFKSKYADLNALLETVCPPLLKHGFDVYQPVQGDKVCSLIVDIETDKIVLRSEISLPVDKITDPQKIGSCVTFYRRYTLQSALGINAEDDDGNQGRKKNDPKRTNQKKELTKEQYEKLLLPANYKYIDKYLSTYDMPEKWRSELSVLVSSD